MYIGVAGNIGCGKTTLTKMLAAYYGWTPRFEPVTENPYLEDYYKDISRWSYNLETYFLAQRFKNLLEIQRCEGTIIQDRTILEGVHIFVENNYRSGKLTRRDYKTYMDLFSVMMQTVRDPDLLIYIRAGVPHLFSQIRKRGRGYEQSMPLDYLAGLNDLYEDWISSYRGKLLVVEGDGLDFENRPEDFSLITDRIDAQLFGLFK